MTALLGLSVRHRTKEPAERGDGSVRMTTVWIYVDTRKGVGEPEHLNADEVAADEWFAENDPEGVAFAYRVRQKSPPAGKE